MTPSTFVLGLGGLLAAALIWGFRHMPRENWQILASLPRHKDETGRWQGLNLTYYGLIVASSYLFAVVIGLIQMGSLGVSPRETLVILLGTLGFAIPASRVVARLVEKNWHSFTVGGASFVGALIGPFAVWGIVLVWGNNLKEELTFPILTALVIGYVFGEGLGRVACISFGCCYGRPVSELGPWGRRIFRHLSFTFEGETKKISYASGLAGVQVVPVQALTSTLYTATGLLCLFLFLEGSYRLAFTLAVVISQGWRVLSEFLRADTRARARFSRYQQMALATLVYCLAVQFVLPSPPIAPPSLRSGLQVLWHPGVILFLQTFWLAMFLFTGRSKITSSQLSFHVQRGRLEAASVPRPRG